MTRISKIQIGFLLAAVALAAWEFQQYSRQNRELATLKTQIQSTSQQFDSRRQFFDNLQQRNRELREAERQAGNQTLLSLLRERNAAAMASQKTNAKLHSVGSALAKTLDSPEQQAADRESLRNQSRAGLYQFFKLLNLPPDKQDQYIDLSVDMDQRKSDRLSALLHGKISFADAVRQRENDDIETEQRRREILGDQGLAFINGIAEGMRDTEAKRLLNIIQDNIGSNRLTPEQFDRLQPIIKSQIVSIDMDDIQLFRPPDQWAQYYQEHQQRAFEAATGILSRSQLEALKSLAALDLADRQQQMSARRQVLGIK